MLGTRPRPRIPLPKQWPSRVRSGVLHAISLASVVLAYARGNTTGRRHLATQLEQAETEIALLLEELSCLSSNCAALPERLFLNRLRSAQWTTLFLR